jgi:hypothetical protein
MGRTASVKVTNSGASGDGRCRLRGGQTLASGGPEEDVWGEWITLTNVPHGTSVEGITPWEPALAAVGYCEPGLRS